MKKLWCFLGVHEYAVISRGRHSTLDSYRRVVATGYYYDMRCSCCGKIKKTIPS